METETDGERCEHWAPHPSEGRQTVAMSLQGLLCNRGVPGGAVSVWTGREGGPEPGPGLEDLSIRGPRTSRLPAQHQLPPPLLWAPGWGRGGKIEDEARRWQGLVFEAGTSLATWLPAHPLVSTRQIQGYGAGRQGPGLWSGHPAVSAKPSELGEAAPDTHTQLALPGPPSCPPPPSPPGELVEAPAAHLGLHLLSETSSRAPRSSFLPQLGIQQALGHSSTPCSSPHLPAPSQRPNAG